MKVCRVLRDSSVFFSDINQDAYISEKGMDETMLTILALSPYFLKIQDFYPLIMFNMESLRNEAKHLPNEANVALQDLAIR